MQHTSQSEKDNWNRLTVTGRPVVHQLPQTPCLFLFPLLGRKKNWFPYLILQEDDVKRDDSQDL